MAPSKSTNSHRFEREITIVPERAGDALTRALEESEDRFRRLVQRVGVGVFRASVDGRFVEVNPALARMLGYAHEAELYDLTMPRDVFADPSECERLRARLARGPYPRRGFPQSCRGRTRKRCLNGSASLEWPRR